MIWNGERLSYTQAISAELNVAPALRNNLESESREKTSILIRRRSCLICARAKATPLASAFCQ